MLRSYVGTVFSHTASARAVSQHADTSNNITATLKCCYIMLHSYVGTIFSHDKFIANSILLQKLRRILQKPRVAAHVAEF